MLEHISTAHEEHSFLCDKCPKILRTKKRMNAHVLAAHTGDKPYPCAFCDSQFSRKSTLNHHTLKKHAQQVPPVINMQPPTTEITESPDELEMNENNVNGKEEYVEDLPVDCSEPLQSIDNNATNFSDALQHIMYVAGVNTPSDYPAITSLPELEYKSSETDLELPSLPLDIVNTSSSCPIDFTDTHSVFSEHVNISENNDFDVDSTQVTSEGISLSFDTNPVLLTDVPVMFSSPMNIYPGLERDTMLDNSIAPISLTLPYHNYDPSQNEEDKLLKSISQQQDLMAEFLASDPENIGLQ